VLQEEIEGGSMRGEHRVHDTAIRRVCDALPVRTGNGTGR
jgi:hypothetical protein